jgi:hypothetical protein
MDFIARGWDAFKIKWKDLETRENGLGYMKKKRPQTDF